MASEAGFAQTGNDASKADVCAVVVTYHPDHGFPDRLARVRPQVGRVVVVDNGSPPPMREMLRNAAAGADVDLILNDANLGVATALNQGVRRARDGSFRWALTLDQDSVAEPFLVEALIGAYEAYPAKDAIAVVGANVYDEKRGKTLVPETPAYPPFLGQTTVITSGTLVSLAAFERIGPFRDDFFIDHVDDDYCLRARSQGFRAILCRRPAIRHSIGSAARLPVPFLNQWTSGHSRERRYYMGRNFTAMAREYLWREPAWVVRTFARHLAFATLMLLFEDDRRGKLRALGAGIRDGLAGRMGKRGP